MIPEVPRIALEMLRVAPDPSVIVTPDGTIVASNGAARELLAIAADARPELSALVSSPRGSLEQLLRMGARTGDPIPGALSLRRETRDDVELACEAARVAPPGRTESGEPVPALVLLRLRPRDPSGDPFVLLNQKLTELSREVQRRRGAEDALRRSESALRERALEAEAANRMKDEFLATISHELRTPLNAVLGWTTMMRQGGLGPDKIDRALETIERNARAQAQLIEELLDVSRIVTGKLRLSVRQVDPIAVVHAALDAVRPAAEAKRIRLQAVLDPDAGPISGDPDRLQQVVWNLLSNAVKFTPKDGRVVVRLERAESNVRIVVSDTGRGIAPEFLPYVFERFRQEDATMTRRHGGLGLGLSIAKSLVDLHGGTIRAQSDGTDRGATFVVVLPRVPVRSDLEVPRPFASAVDVAAIRRGLDCPPQIEGLRVLVVDDEPDALELVVSVLEACGARVTGARSAGEALDALRASQPDVLVSDIGMPGENGYELMRRVRALPPGQGGATPAIALTAYARTEDRLRALGAGFEYHVPKPVEPAELLAVVATLVARTRTP